MKRSIAFLLFALGLAAADPAIAEIVTGTVVSIEPAFNTIHIMRKAPDGQEAPAKVVWDDFFPQDQEMENSEVGFPVTVEADKDFFGNWQVKKVLPDPIF